MAAIYRNRKYGNGDLFKKKRYKNSSKKFIEKRIKIKLQIITFDVCSSPGLTEAKPIQPSNSQTKMYFNGIVGNRIDVKIQL